MMKRILACILAVSGLAACAPLDARLVQALDPPKFVEMSRAMRPVMIRKNMVDANGDWYSPLLPFSPDGAGKTLVDRLSPSFRFSGERSQQPTTFRATLMPGAKVEYQGNKAVIVQGMSQVTLELVAVTDWNNDGKDDWLVSCRVGYVDTPRRYREYYLTVTDLSAAVLMPRVQMILDHVYGKSTIVEDSSTGELVDSAVIQYLPGQAAIMEAPDRKAVEESLASGSKLGKTVLRD